MNITIKISAPELAKSIDNLAIALMNPKLTSLALPQTAINKIKRDTKAEAVAKVKSDAAAVVAEKMRQIGI